MMSVLLDTTVTHLRALRTPFHTKDVLKALPGARWDRGVHAWVYPKSGQIAMALTSLFPAAEIDAGVKTLLGAASRENQAMTTKFSLDLPDVPEVILTPWMHQKQAFWFAVQRLGLSVQETTTGGGVMLAMDMGTGKTKVIYDLLNSYPDQLGTVLVSCPKAVCQTWKDERKKHGKGRIMVKILPEGPVKKRTEQSRRFLRATSGLQRMLVINHESTWREPFKTFVKENVWDLLVVDECHRAKAPGGRFSTFLAKNQMIFSHRVGLTGTPMPRDPMDLYAQARFLEPGIYGTNFTRFKNKYGIWGGFEKRKLIGIAREEELYAKLDSFCFRVDADTVLDLPPTSHMRRMCTLSPKERLAYQQMEDDLIADVGTGVVTAANALVRLLKLQQIVQGSITDDDGNFHRIGTTKQSLLKDVLEDLPAKEPVIIFARFTDDLKRIHEVCESLDRKSLELSGKKNELKEWKAGAAPILATQIQAGGVGVDLSRSCYTIYYSPTFDMGAHQQSLARTHRPGQTRPTFYYYLIAQATMDVRIYQALRDKKKVVDSVLAGMMQGGDNESE